MARPSPFNPLTFLDLARRLNHDDEAELRTAIGRAYYAIRLRTQQSLEAGGRMLSDEPRHADVWIALGRIHRQAGHRLSAMYRARERADYRLEAQVDQLQTDLKESLDNAEYIAKASAGAWSTLPQ